MKEGKKKREQQQKKREKEQNTLKKKRKNMQQEVNQDNEVFDENTCKVCLISYEPTDDELRPWVMCDKCGMWMHIACVPVGVDMTPIESDEEFFCYECI